MALVSLGVTLYLLQVHIREAVRDEVGFVENVLTWLVRGALELSSLRLQHVGREPCLLLGAPGSNLRYRGVAVSYSVHSSLLEAEHLVFEVHGLLGWLLLWLHGVEG